MFLYFPFNNRPLDELTFSKTLVLSVWYGVSSCRVTLASPIGHLRTVWHRVRSSLLQTNHRKERLLFGRSLRIHQLVWSWQHAACSAKIGLAAAVSSRHLADEIEGTCLPPCLSVRKF